MRNCIMVRDVMHLHEHTMANSSRLRGLLCVWEMKSYCPVGVH